MSDFPVCSLGYHRGLVLVGVLEPPVLEPPLSLALLLAMVVFKEFSMALGDSGSFFIIQKPETQKVDFLREKNMSKFGCPYGKGFTSIKSRKIHDNDKLQRPIAHADPNVDSLHVHAKNIMNLEKH